MLKVRTMLFALTSAFALIALSVATANAQQWSPADSQKWVNNPCADPRISWGLWKETPRPQGGVDCDPANYDFTMVHSEVDMNNQISAYRRWQKNNLTLYKGVVTDKIGDRFQEIIERQSGVPMLLKVGRVLSREGSNVRTNDGASIIPPSPYFYPGMTQGTGVFGGTIPRNRALIQLRGRWFLIPH